MNFEVFLLGPLDNTPVGARKFYENFSGQSGVAIDQLKDILSKGPMQLKAGLDSNDALNLSGRIKSLGGNVIINLHGFAQDVLSVGDACPVCAMIIEDVELCPDCGLVLATIIKKVKKEYKLFGYKVSLILQISLLIVFSLLALYLFIQPFLDDVFYNNAIYVKNNIHSGSNFNVSGDYSSEAWKLSLLEGFPIKYYKNLNMAQIKQEDVEGLWSFIPIINLEEIDVFGEIKITIKGNDVYKTRGTIIIKIRDSKKIKLIFKEKSINSTLTNYGHMFLIFANQSKIMANIIDDKYMEGWLSIPPDILPDPNSNIPLVLHLQGSKI